MLLIAGPCSAESRRQVLDTAKAVAAAGAAIFRAGVWKPRTKPGSFEGRGEEALDWLREVKDSLGMIPFTEIATPRHLRAALDAGIDSFWIGARTAANPFAVQELADAISHLPSEVRKNITILVKNPVNPDLELWIGAIERIRRSGIGRLGAIHRGFSTYGEHLYRNPPHWAIPIELKRRMPWLPVICDPSHIGGERNLVAPLSQEALDMNFDGFIIESHCNPTEALSDALQQLTPAELSALLDGLSIRSHSEPTESLEGLRRKIDDTDDEILALLARRMDIAREIGAYKRQHGLPVVQPDRYNNLMEKRAAEGEALGLPRNFVRRILALVHEESVRTQISTNPDKKA